jgi:hypothetical protein
MNINRFNYEEYFLLYVDNELTTEERQAVDHFVQENPDLEEELLMLRQSQLKPEAVVMDNKSALYKKDRNEKIHLENYQTFFLLYVDEELSAEERRGVEAFVAANPSTQEEFQLLLQTKVEADEKVVFANKEVLYKVASGRRVVSINIWRVTAVAAVLLIMLGIFWISSSPRQGTNNPIANQGMKVEKHEQLPVRKINPSSSPVQLEHSTAAKEVQKKEQKNEIRKVQPAIDENSKQLAINKSEPDQSVNSIEPDAAHEPKPVTIAKVDALNTTTVGSASVSGNTLIVAAPHGTVTGYNPETDAAEDFVSTDNQKKSKLRGFLRQVSRVVEKTTHVPAGNKKLLIGNIEIALK